MALAVALLSIVNGLTTLLPTPHGRLTLLYLLIDTFAPFVPSGGIFVYTGRTLALLLGFFLFLVALGLVRGKERAWQCAVVLLPLSALAHLMKGLNIEAALLITGIWAMLLYFRNYFRVESDPWHMRQGVAFLGLGCVLLFIYLLGGYSLLQNQFFTTGVAHAVAHALLRRVVDLPSHEVIPETHIARWFLSSIPWLSSAVFLTGMVLILRPVSGRWWLHYQRERNEQMHAKAWELIKTFGVQTMAFFALDARNMRYIAPGGEGVVNYRLIGDTAVVVGDPVAAPEARERVLKQFLSLCALKDWRMAVYQARADDLPLYRKLRLTVMKIGEEALLHPQTFLLKGAAMANVRTSSRRAEREGVFLDWYEGEPPREVLALLQELSQTWLQGKGSKQNNEMGFSMGRLSELCEAGRRSEQIAMPVAQEQGATPCLMLAVARNRGGVPCAFMSFTPIYGCLRIDEDGKYVRMGWGWALDLMRRVPDAPPGVMELLIVQAVERFRDAGAEIFSLGMVGLADTRQEMSPGQQNLARLATEHIQWLETHRSLLQFKQKFQPTWESRYVIASSALALPKVGIALLRAHQA
ncbi:MAG TPA: phosphatidylglycerol lysyltransferase domain-containing protein [Ktedonobacteraceae bacterium]|nr:phosphatidylglycerol lysyltransferase domain-containing protein [Ktedonobacteraceae bacterium]